MSDPSRTVSRMTPSTEERIRALLAHSPVVDDTTTCPGRWRGCYDSTRSTWPPIWTPGCCRLPQWAGGLGAQFWSVFVPCSLAGRRGTATLEQIDAVHRWRATPASWPSPVRPTRPRRRAGGRVASLIGMEGGHSIDCSLGTLRMMYALGARYLTLAHFRNTPWSDSATDVPGVGGLSPFGHEVVRECNRLGMLVDLAHVADTTMHAALDTSTAPAFFSHSSARALCGHVATFPTISGRHTNGIVMVTRTRVPKQVRPRVRHPSPAYATRRYQRLEGRVRRAGRLVTRSGNHADYIRQAPGRDRVGSAGTSTACRAAGRAGGGRVPAPGRAGDRAGPMPTSAADPAQRAASPARHRKSAAREASTPRPSTASFAGY